MSQVQNLLDLFQKSRGAMFPAGAEIGPAPKPNPGLNPAGKIDRNAGSLLPINPGGPAKGNTHVSPAKDSFLAKMEKSAAKLSAKTPAPKHTSPKPAKAPGRTSAEEEARAPKAEPERPVARNDAPKRAHDSRDGRPARSQAKPKTPAKDDADQSQADQDADANQTAADVTSAASAAQPDASAQNDQAQGLDEKTRAAIKKGLAELGIQVDDKQLQDPAFLRNILRMLQAVPVQALPDDGTQTASAPAPDLGTAAAPAAGTASPGDAAQIASVPAPAPAADPAVPQAKTAGAEVTPALPDGKAQAAVPKTLTRADLARLLEARIGGLERAAQGRADGIQVSAQAPTVTPKEWQGVQARPQAEGPGTDPLPLADLDRLRVMQASAMQTAPAKAETNGPRTSLVLESDSVDAASETAPMGRVAAVGDASSAQDQDAQSDLLGQGGERTAGAQILPGKEAAPPVKDGVAGTPFNQVLDQLRPTDLRAGLIPGAEPRAPLHDTAVLDQIVRKMTVTTHKSGDEISIQLTPENLGKVHVSLEMKDDGMSARISVENDSVRRQMEANLSSLKDALRDQGIQLQGMEVSVDQRHASLFNPDGSNADSFFRRQGRGDGREGTGREVDAISLESAPESDTGRRWGYNTLEYIG